MRRPVLFGKYLLLDRISVGGMAEVFQAKSFGVEGFEKILAIKRILPSMAEDEDFIEMFIDEAKIAGQLSHANICQIFELGKIDSSHFIAMEFVWGKDTLQLQNRFRRLRRRMPLSMAAFIVAKACEGLDYAHRKRDPNGVPLDIIHRDVSPQNILVSYEGEAKVIDFGIAKAVSRSSKTQAGVLKGKFGYMSPEQVRGLPLDRRSDVFAAGTILWEMCVGERLFTGESDFSILEKVRNADVPSPSAQNPMIPAELERIILKALAREADDRYQWGNEMQEDLMNFLMSQSPVFTAKQLSAAVKDMFARERQREQAALEEYKRIRREDLDQYAPPGGKREVAVSMLSGPAPMVAAPAADPLPEDFDDGRTELGGPEFIDDADVDPLDDDDISEITDDPPHYDDHRTEIYDDQGAPAPQPMAAEPTFIFNAESGQIVHAPDQSTVIFSDLAARGGGNGSGASALPAQGPTVIFDADGTGNVSLPAHPISGTVPVVAPARPTLVKDILIGVLLAVVVILGVVLWRVFAAGGAKPQMATVVISTSPPVAAEVLIDAQPVGKIAAGMPFTQEIVAGDHRVAIIVGKADPLVQAVALKAGQVRVIAFKVVKAVGHVKLRVEPDDARVLIDDKEVSRAAARDRLELTAGVKHTIKVIKAGFRPQTITIELIAGETIERQVTLEAEAKTGVLIESKPSGAAVRIDGKERGVTPLKLESLPAAKYRVSIAKEDYETKSVWLVVGADGKASLSLTLVRASGGTSANGWPAGRKTGGRKASGAGRAEGHRTRGEGHRASGGKKPGRDTARKPKGPPGYLIANTTPWAKVIIDGKNTGKTTPVVGPSKIPLAAGRHTVTFVAGGKRFSFKITIRSGENFKLIKKLPVE